MAAHTPERQLAAIVKAHHDLRKAREKSLLPSAGEAQAVASDSLVSERKLKD